MPFDVIDFIPSPDVREECRRVGKTFNTREKAAIVFWSNKPMKERIGAYITIGEEDREYQKNLSPIVEWMRDKLESFPKSEEGFIFFSGNRGTFTGQLEYCVNTAYMPILERCKESIGIGNQIMVTKAVVNRDYYQLAFLNTDGEIMNICEFSSEFKSGHDPEKRLNTYRPYIPCPFKKGDMVCFFFNDTEPMIFMEREDQLRFKYIGEDCLTGCIFKSASALYSQLIYYQDELPNSELQIIQKAVRGELDFVSAYNLMRKSRLEKLNEHTE